MSSGITNGFNDAPNFYIFTNPLTLYDMASIKQLKDDINQLTYELINECFTFKIYHPDKGNRADKAISEIVKLRNELIYRTNHPNNKEGSEKLRTHFNKIRTDLGKLVLMVEDLGKDG